MKIFEIIKQEVPIREAARRYGLTVSQSGMACCPFHGDTHPSLKLNADYFFCFGCGATGDVIDFTSCPLIPNSRFVKSITSPVSSQPKQIKSSAFTFRLGWVSPWNGQQALPL